MAKKPTANKHHAMIANVDLVADDYQAALRSLKRLLKTATANAHGAEASAAAHSLRALRHLESLARDNARDRIRQAGGAA